MSEEPLHVQVARALGATLENLGPREGAGRPSWLEAHEDVWMQRLEIGDRVEWEYVPPYGDGAPQGHAVTLGVLLPSMVCCYEEIRLTRHPMTGHLKPFFAEWGPRDWKTPLIGCPGATLSEAVARLYLQLKAGR